MNEAGFGRLVGLISYEDGDWISTSNMGWTLNHPTPPNPMLLYMDSASSSPMGISFIAPASAMSWAWQRLSSDTNQKMAASTVDPQDASLTVAKIPRDSLSFLVFEDSTLGLAIYTHIALKGTGTLCKYVDWATEGGKRTDVDAVRVSGTNHVRPRSVDGVMAI
ncbi:unnamed protein product [Clonostachys rhizophaga]|uniref:Uncharacterized protein n=1 Tax=Clonostachys rhizophaga TaxID=160324 RepID=A0A9N9YW11_9HYPO|nr:unnamed protein product [Clonostachys rhizophaga]